MAEILQPASVSSSANGEFSNGALSQSNVPGAQSISAGKLRSTNLVQLQEIDTLEQTK